MRLITRHFRARGKAAIASLLVCVVLLLDAMAACPKLHELIHKDADKPGHECAVTMFAHGQVETASVDVPVIVPVTLVEIVPAVILSVFAPAIEHLPAGRAPPVLPVNS